MVEISQDMPIVSISLIKKEYKLNLNVKYISYSFTGLNIYLKLKIVKFIPIWIARKNEHHPDLTLLHKPFNTSFTVVNFMVTNINNLQNAWTGIVKTRNFFYTFSSHQAIQSVKNMTQQWIEILEYSLLEKPLIFSKKSIIKNSWLNFKSFHTDKLLWINKCII